MSETIKCQKCGSNISTSEPSWKRLKELERQLAKVTEERDIWLYNHKELNKGYNELDVRWRKEKERAEQAEQAKSEKLAGKVAMLRERAAALLGAIVVEAKARQSCDVAIANYDDSQAEERLLLKALLQTSDADKELRKALAESDVEAYLAERDVKVLVEAIERIRSELNIEKRSDLSQFECGLDEAASYIEDMISERKKKG